MQRQQYLEAINLQEKLKQSYEPKRYFEHQKLDLQPMLYSMSLKSKSQIEILSDQGKNSATANNSGDKNMILKS